MTEKRDDSSSGQNQTENEAKQELNEGDKQVVTSPNLVKRLIEECGKHPFVTGLFAILGLVSFLFSIYAFGVDRSESLASTQTQQAIADKITSVEKEIISLSEEQIEEDAFVPLDAFLDNYSMMRFADNITYSPEYDYIPVRALDYPSYFEEKFHGRWTEARLEIANEDQHSFAHHFSTDFSLTSLSDTNFVQVAPYIVIDVKAVTPISDGLHMLYDGGRGGGAVIWEAAPALPPKPGTYFAPFVYQETDEIRTDVDYVKLMPREPEEFIVAPRMAIGNVYEMRYGLHYKYKNQHRIHWVTPYFRNGIPHYPIPQWDFKGGFETRLYDDAVKVDLEVLESRSKEYNEHVTKNKVFSPDKIANLLQR